MQDPVLRQHQFTGVSIPRYFSAASNAHFLQFIFNIVEPSVSSPSNEPFPCGIFSNTSLTVLSSGILSTRPIHCNRPFLISNSISGSLYRFINSSLLRVPQRPFNFTEPNIFLLIFLPILLSCFHCFARVRRPESYITTYLIDFR